MFKESPFRSNLHASSAKIKASRLADVILCGLLAVLIFWPARLTAQEKKEPSASASEPPNGGAIDESLRSIYPNLPPDQQPLNDNSNPNPVAHPPLALHPDRFTPGSNAAATAGVSDIQKPDVPSSLVRDQQSPPAAKENKPVAKPVVKAAPKAGQPSGSAPGDTQTPKPSLTEKPQRNP